MLGVTSSIHTLPQGTETSGLETAQISVSIPLLGNILDGLLESVDRSIEEAINSARNAGLDLEIEAGRQIGIAIENAKNAYKDSLDHTIDQAGKAIQEQVEQLKSMVQDLQNKVTEELEKLESKTQQFILSLPFANKQTQLSRVQPRYAVIADGAPKVHFKFEGVFYYSASAGFEPTLSFGDQVYAPVSTTTQSLEFEIPTGSLISNEDDAMTKNSYASGILSAPWDNGWIWSNRVESTYKVYLGALPLSPGKIQVEYTAKKIVTVTKHFVSGTIDAWADKHYPKKWVVIENTTYAEAGWQICSEARAVIHAGAHGNHDNPIVSRRERTFVISQVGLAAFDGKHMGRVSYHVEFDEAQEQTHITKRVEEIKLKWGDSCIIEPNEDEEVSKFIFDAFADGSHNEYAGPTLDNPYLKISAEHGKYRLSAEVPKMYKA